jgi:superoxide reductase
MNIYVCQVCGHVSFKDPETCPVCYAPKEKFELSEKIFEEAKAQVSGEGPKKHTPKINLSGSEIDFTIGEIEHPMLPEHYIMFVDVYLNDKFVQRVQYTSNLIPAGCLKVKDSGLVRVVSKCNLHGYWMSEATI